MGVSSPGISFATTVTGPDAYGAAPVVGTDLTVAHGAHDHGLPAAPAPVLPYAGATLIADVAIAAATATTIITTATLGVGKWLIIAQAEILNGGTTAGDCELYVVAGTAVLGFVGPTSADALLPASASAQLTFSTIAVISTAGTLVIGAYSAVAATAKLNATAGFATATYPTGYTAVQIA